MKKAIKTRRLEIDNTPPGVKGKSVRRDIFAVRAIPKGMQILIQSEVNRAVQEAMVELRAEMRKTGTLHSKASGLQPRKARSAS